MHTSHHDIHVHGLADDCPGCGQIADSPTLYADRFILADLAERALARANGGGFNGRSETEDVAVASVLNILERAGKLAECAGPTFATYLRERWRLEASISLPASHPLASHG